MEIATYMALKNLNLLFSDEWNGSYPEILHNVGRNPINVRFLDTLKQILSPTEFRAVSLWVSTFFGYQQNWLLDPTKQSILVKSRQTGGSHTYAAVAVLWAILGDRTAIISVGQREADRVLEYAKKHVEALQLLGSSIAKLSRKTAEIIVLSNGGAVSSLPPTSGARGDSTNVILDEAAYYKNPSPEKVIDNAFAATTHHDYRIRILSTPNGMGNKFYDLVKNAQANGYRLHSVTIEQAIAGGLDVKLKDCWDRCLNDPRMFGQVYNCSFLDSQFQYIPNHLIEACISNFPPVTSDPYYGGLDIGRTNDLTVLITIQRLPKIEGKKQCWTIRGLEYRKRTDDEGLKQLVADSFERYNYRQLALDCTGIGAFPAEAMVKRHGVSRVEPIHFTMQVKEELATSLYLAISEKRLTIPNAIPGVDPLQLKLLREDIASIQRIITDKGNVVYDAPHSVNGHADRAWALALAVNAAINAPTYARLSI